MEICKENKHLGAYGIVIENNKDLNKEITVIRNDNTKKARAISIDDNARLEVEYETGEREFLSSGEISIKL